MFVLHMTLLMTCHSLLICCLQIGTKLEFYELINDISNDISNNIIEQVCQNSDDLLVYVEVLGKWTK